MSDRKMLTDAEAKADMDELRTLNTTLWRALRAFREGKNIEEALLRNSLALAQQIKLDDQVFKNEKERLKEARASARREAVFEQEHMEKLEVSNFSFRHYFNSN